MKFQKIAGLVPEGEHFDESAIVNEGGFLSVAHLAALENDLGDSTNAEALEQANASIVELTTARDTAMQELGAITENLTAAQETITIRDARIAELEVQLAEFTKQPSGDGTVLHTTGDNVNTGANEKPAKKGLLNPEHPLNVAAKQAVERTAKK
jgi:hypothetical protein